MLGLVFWNQSSNDPDAGQSGATVWLRAVTSSLVKWKAGNRTTGVRPVVCALDALADSGKTSDISRTTSTAGAVAPRFDR